MSCVLCGQRDVDGAIDQCGQYVCVDCWASGEAAMSGLQAQAFVGANVPYAVSYPAEMQRRFLDACNHRS